MKKPDPLTRREREIMDILHRRGRATAHEVMDDLADPPSYSAVRTFLRLLEAIAEASDGGDHIGTELLPDARDKHLDRIRIAVEILVVDMLD